QLKTVSKSLHANQRALQLLKKARSPQRNPKPRPSRQLRHRQKVKQTLKNPQQKNQKKTVNPHASRLRAQKRARLARRSGEWRRYPSITVSAISISPPSQLTKR